MSRIACFCAACGTSAKIASASRSHVLIAVPPDGRMYEMARLASSRAPGSICTIATGAFGYGKARLATWLPPMTANQVPSAIWSTATCAAYLAASMFGPLIDPEVSMMTISATPPLLRRGGTRAGAGHRDDRVHVRGAVGEELVLEHLGAEVGHCGSSIRLRSVPGRPGRPRRCGQYRRVLRRGPAPR